uniref:DUF4351 domain-containing protein n=2 Tax=Candidatus Kentrum sp. FW TaxID=2126338 RepID=A0A450TA01_9GAMM|nr:MAG: protein of unknown function (DUF4351) [Candidatus Kentron sp. FW]
MQQGMQRGLERGLEKGLEKGRLEGKAEEAVAILERLLVKRFGPLGEGTKKRLKLATLEQLDYWSDRILDASTIDTIFEEH